MTLQMFTSIDDYISSFPKEVQEILQKVRTIIRKVIPDGEEAINYSMPTIKRNGKYVIYFAAWKKHISLYPVPTGSTELPKEIEPYIAGKGTVKFLLKNPIPYDLIEKIVNAIMEEVV